MIAKSTIYLEIQGSEKPLENLVHVLHSMYTYDAMYCGHWEGIINRYVPKF